MSLREREHAFAGVCFEETLPRQAAARLGFTEKDLKLYRDMVRGRLWDLLKSALPRTFVAMGYARFADEFSGFLEKRPPQTRFIRETVGCFADFELGEPRNSFAPPWIADLLRLESTIWELGYAPVALCSEATEFDFEKVPLLNPTCRLLHLEFPVHRVLEAYDPEQVHVCICRNLSTHNIETWELNPEAAMLVSTWQSSAYESVRSPASSRTAAQSIRDAACTQKKVIDSAYVEGLCDVIARFIERGLILGSVSERTMKKGRPSKRRPP